MGVNLWQLLASATTGTGVPDPPATGWVGWVVSVLMLALTTVTGIAWRTVRADAKDRLAAANAREAAALAREAAARAEIKELNETLLRDVVPAMVRTADVTQRATEALLLAQGHR